MWGIFPAYSPGRGPCLWKCQTTDQEILVPGEVSKLPGDSRVSQINRSFSCSECQILYFGISDAIWFCIDVQTFILCSRFKAISSRKKFLWKGKNIVFRLRLTIITELKEIWVLTDCSTFDLHSSDILTVPDFSSMFGSCTSIHRVQDYLSSKITVEYWTLDEP